MRSSKMLGHYYIYYNDKKLLLHLTLSMPLSLWKLDSLSIVKKIKTFSDLFSAQEMCQIVQQEDMISDDEDMAIYNP